MMWVSLLGVACHDPKGDDGAPADVDDGTPSGEDDVIDVDPDTAGSPGFSLSNVSSSVHGIVRSVIVVGWDQSDDATVHVEFGFDEGVTLTSPERSLGAGHHEELLLGIPYDTDVTWRIVAVSEDGPVTPGDDVVRTGPLPELMPQPTLLASDPTGYDASLPWVLTSFAGLDYYTRFTVVLDRQGRVVWAMISPPDRFTEQSRISATGDSLLIDHNSLLAIFDGGALSEVVERKIDGSLIHTFATPGLHQPFTGLPDGSVAYARTHGPGYLEDLVVVARDGSTSTVFDCSAWIAGLSPDLYCGSNTVTFDPITGHYLMSMYATPSVVEVDPVSHEAVRWFGNLPGSWAFDPADSVLTYPHGAYFGDEGTLLVSDFSPFPGDPVVREFTLDPATETLTEIVRFGEGEGMTGYGYGGVFRLPNGNTHQNCGIARLREFTPEAEVVWDLEWSAQEVFFIGRSTPFADLYALAPERP